ncbi:MAG: metal-dependent hydrolase [candidate division WS1 bacterium]|jgi:L-ascorbate metabolism protein UlaG (beta-lactamase superfamily)|nr:metal-dependent hydrolase [candidate division WS1 bacterium]
MAARLTFHGHSCFAMEADGRRIIIDPFLSGNSKASGSADEIEVDAVLLTHAHGDHLGDGIEIARRNNALVVAVNELAIHCRREGVQKVLPMNIGGASDLGFARVKLTVAHHSSAIVSEDGITMLGTACGFLVTMGGVTLYHTGDTGLTAEMELVGRYNEVDVATICCGDVFTMGVDDGIIAAELIGAKLNIPMHFGTFPAIETDPQEFVGRLEEKGISARVMKPGDEIELSGPR